MYHRAGALFVCDAINPSNQTQDLVSACDIEMHSSSVFESTLALQKHK